MEHVGRLAAAILALVALLNVCGGPSKTAPRNSVPCREATALATVDGDPEWFGARLGPFVIRHFHAGASRAVVDDFQAGYATKFVFRPVENAGPTTLSGHSCPDGRALLFWFGSGSPFADLPSTQEDFKRIGQPRIPLPSVRRTTKESLGGFFLFSAPGMYEIDISDQSDVKIGSVTVVVKG